MDIVEEIINDEKDAKRVYYFRKFLMPIVISTIVMAVLIASYNYYSARREAHSKKIGDMFADLVMGGVSQPVVAEESLHDIIENSDIRLADLAKIKLAHESIHGNDIEKAKEQLESIIGDSSVLEITKSYAHILLISAILDQEALSESDQLQVSNLLHYFADKNKMFYGNSQLLKALFHFRVKQFDIAMTTADTILAMGDIPSVVKDQASALKVMIKYQK